MLKDILEKRKCFKLVCAAGNEDEKEVEKLTALYSLAGCNFFDICAKAEIIDAAKRGLEFAGNLNDRYLCVSVGLSNDPHVSKASINNNCTKCNACKDICPRNAIAGGIVAEKRCIGCLKCKEVCPNSAIDIKSELKDLREILPPLVEKGIDCIELHAQGEDEDEAIKKWNDINACYGGILSICTDRSKLGNEKILKRVKKMLSQRAPYTTIIQADGAPMSGSEDDFKTTLQTVAMAEIFEHENLNAYLLLSGGTNSKSTELAKLCGIRAHGVAIGTWARKIVQKYTDREDFLKNEEIFSKALCIAKNLVDTSLKYL